MNIRFAKPEDIYTISEIYKNSVKELCSADYDAEIIEHWQNSTSPESRLDLISNKALWVAEAENEIGGYMAAIPGELLALFISPSCAGKGIGKSLGELGVEVASNSYTSNVVLESTITAAPFYKKLGFQEVGTGYFTHGSSNLKIPVVNMVFEV